ncbi:hypothetical protein CsSME_00021212 [Camellia sinensis var. sinensis]
MEKQTNFGCGSVVNSGRETKLEEDEEDFRSCCEDEDELMEREESAKESSKDILDEGSVNMFFKGISIAKSGECGTGISFLSFFFFFFHEKFRSNSSAPKPHSSSLLLRYSVPCPKHHPISQPHSHHSQIGFVSQQWPQFLQVPGGISGSVPAETEPWVCGFAGI